MTAPLTEDELAAIPRLGATLRHERAVAAAERALRKAEERYVGGLTELREGEDEIVGALAALRALGVEP